MTDTLVLGLHSKSRSAGKENLTIYLSLRSGLTSFSSLAVSMVTVGGASTVADCTFSVEVLGVVTSAAAVCASPVTVSFVAGTSATAGVSVPAGAVLVSSSSLGYGAIFSMTVNIRLFPSIT